MSLNDSDESQRDCRKNKKCSSKLAAKNLQQIIFFNELMQIQKVVQFM